MRVIFSVCSVLSWLGLVHTLNVTVCVHVYVCVLCEYQSVCVCACVSASVCLFSSVCIFEGSIEQHFETQIKERKQYPHISVMWCLCVY